MLLLVKLVVTCFSFTLADTHYAHTPARTARFQNFGGNNLYGPDDGNGNGNGGGNFNYVPTDYAGTRGSCAYFAVLFRGNGESSTLPGL